MPTLHDQDIISNRNGKTVALLQMVARKLGSVTTIACAEDNSHKVTYPRRERRDRTPGFLGANSRPSR